MSYNFKIYRDDIILDTNNSTRNYGREFVVKMPIVLWYAHKHFSGENLFRDSEMPEAITKMDDVPRSNLDKIVDRVISASSKLPKKLNGNNGVNTDLKCWDLSSFDGPENKYHILIKKDTLDILKDKDIDVSVANYAVELFTSNYFLLIAEWDEMIAFRPMINHVYKRLRDES